MFGLLLIPLALVFLWKNEKKIVMYARVITEAKKSCKSVNCDEVLDDNDFNLVHSQGKALNEQIIKDPEFGATAADSYRVIRTVEMYQTLETMKESKNGDQVTRTYTYHDAWVSSAVSCSNFHDQSKRKNNPTIEWPYHSKKFEAESVTLG